MEIKDLRFAGKIALRASDNSYLKLLNNNTKVIVFESGLDEMSTFCLYHDRYNPPQAYIWHPGHRAFWNTYKLTQGKLGVVLAGGEVFSLEPIPNDPEGRVHIVHQKERGHMEASPFGAQLTIYRGNRPIQFTVVKITKGIDDALYDWGWNDADLSGVDFTGIESDLAGFTPDHWRGANLRGANFSGMNIVRIGLYLHKDWQDAKLQNTTFDGHTGLREANFDGADLNGASLQNVDLTNASMVGTNFRNANLTGAKLGTKPRVSTNPMKRTVFARATLTTSRDAPIFKDWSYLDMSEVNLHPTDGEPLDLSGLKAEDALLKGIDVRESDLSGAQLVRCDMIEARLDSATVTNATLNECNMTGATMTQANLSGARLSQCNLSEARLDSATVTNATLDNCNMTGATMTQANLSQSSLQGVILQKATLSGVKLVNANCTGAQLGAEKKVFALPAEQRALLSQGALSSALREIFAAHGVALAESAFLTVRDPECSWLVANGEERFRLGLDSSGAIQVHQVLEIDNAAVLSKAYMPNANFTNANLFAVNMSGAHWYGSNASAAYANMEQIDASNANFGSLNLEKAALRGATLSNAILAMANLRRADLRKSDAGRQCSLKAATLVGADFTGADLTDVILHDASVSITVCADGVSVNGVPLFHMSADLAADLDKCKLSDEVKEACKRSGYPLTDDAKIEAVKKGIHWEINNGGDEGTKVGSGYSTLSIVRQTDALHVVGSAIWIMRVGDEGQHLETIQFKYDATKLSNLELTPTTTCPNGVLWKHNQSDGRTWEQVMTPQEPPTLPECVPSPEAWCTLR